jgi:hypothetical protein
MRRRAPAVATRSLTRRQTVGGLGALLGSAWLAGCAGGAHPKDKAGKHPAPPKERPQPRPSGSLTGATVSISNTKLGTIGPGFAGLSYEKDSLALPRFTSENTQLIGLFRRLGESVLRIGGNTVDSTHWIENGAGGTSGQIGPPDIDALRGFLAGCGWSVLYGVNLATSTPAVAAAEVDYVSRRLGQRLYGIEIGNEPDLYGSHYFPQWSLTDFERRWQQFRDAIVRKVPQVGVTGPGSSWNVLNWTAPFGAYARGQIALLTQHYYRGNGQGAGATGAALVSPDATLVAELKELRPAAASIGVPFRMTETNSYFNGGAPGVSNSYASALWVIDHLFNICHGGGAGANLHGGGDGPGYTPIADHNGAVTGARPSYYGMLLFTMAGEGTVLETAVSAGQLNVSAYALQRADGLLAIVVVNKEPKHSLKLSIDCGRSVKSALLLGMSGPSLDATSGVRLQDAEVHNDGSFSPKRPYTLTTSGNEVSAYVEPLGAVLIVTG